MSTVHVVHHGMPGQGKNVTEAKKDAGRKLEQAVSGSYEPAVISFRGQAVLVYRHQFGWDYCTLADERGFRTSLCTGTFQFSKGTALDMARFHLAQMTWLPADGNETPLPLEGPFLREFRNWAEFQLRYVEGIENGLGPVDAHDYAGRNPARPELWSTTQPVNS